MTKTKTLHMIGNAHIDPVWLWQWQEGFQEVLASFRSALDRMNEDPDFCFTASSAAFYAWVERVDPGMFEEIQARVAEGRWELAGGWWIEPDCNVPGGESFARQALYAQRYFQEKFGRRARVGFAVDSFGHNAALPQLLRKSGLDAYVFMRPGPHEKGLPGRLFWWEADDRSRVLAYRIPFQYGSWGPDLEPHVRRTAAELKPPIDTLACFYGVGNHGGGPTKENIATLRRLDGEPDLPKLVFSTLTRFFDEVREKAWPLPVVHDELQHHASGCYAAHSGVKRWNRQAENALLRAEKWAAVAAMITGLSYPGSDFERAWQNVLFNQFHDILAGTSLEEAYDDVRNLYGEALAIADRALNDAVQSVAWSIRIPEAPGVKPIVAFNPHAWESHAEIELEMGRLAEGTALLDDDGKAVPFQEVQSHATAGGRSRIAFMAKLPPLGYRVYQLAPEGPAPESAPLTATDTSLENARFRLEFDPATGYLISLFDKEAGVEALTGPAARPVVIADPSDTWSHNVFRFDVEVGAFTVSRMRVVEEGPVKAVLRVKSVWGRSRLVQDFTLYASPDGPPRIDVHVTVDWHEQFRMLKLRFPINVRMMAPTHAIPYGHIERFANGEEEPIQAWVDLSGTIRDGEIAYGLSVLNDGKASADVNVRDIGLTVLRSPIYAHHMPAEPQPDRDYSFIDQGRQTFTYSLLPHRGGWEDGGTVRHAAELNQRPVALIATYRDGPLPLSESYLEVDQDNIVVTVLKQAEDNDDLILRAYETAGRATRATLRLPKWDREILANFARGEIKTFRIPRDPAAPVAETDFLETS
ncbi:MAG: alpha-mannosidase [Anaerolineae bacterium]